MNKYFLEVLTASIFMAMLALLLRMLMDAKAQNQALVLLNKAARAAAETVDPGAIDAAELPPGLPE